MTSTEAASRIKKLRTEIEYHRYLYHVEDRQEISEAALDSLKRELVQLERQFPQFITPDSPSQRVAGGVLPGFQKVTHSKPVLSLEDAFTFDDLAEWQKRNEKLLKEAIKGYYCELKFDGLSVVVTYEDGLLVRGATRGDGRIGEDITQNLRTIESIPLRLNLSKLKKFPRRIEVRGEVVMTKKYFEALNKDQARRGLPLYANPRNTAAGSIRQLDSSITASRKLECFMFELITNCGQKTHAEAHRLLAQLGFKTSAYNEEAKDLAAVRKYLEKWESKRHDLPYNTDGSVIVANTLSQEERLGSVGKTERWMIAYKFAAEQATTVVQDIIVQIGRTGALTPVAVLKPVLIAGTTVSRATLHNEDEIKRLDVRVGDTVILQKAGDIIPDVISVLKNLRPKHTKPFVFPKKCPICGSKVERPKGEVAHYCTNKQCFAQEREGIIHFVSKKGFDIDGLGEKIVEQLMQVGLVRTSADLFKLTKDDILPLEGFAEKSAENLVRAVEKAKRVPLAKFIYALGIRHVGEETARDLARVFPSIEKLSQASLTDLLRIKDIGEIMAQSMVSWFKEPRNKKLIAAFKQVGVKVEAPAKPAHASRLAGKTFVITGTLEEPREVIAEYIRAAGGSVSGSVSKQTDYLVAGKDPGSKLQKAQSLNVQIIDYAQLQRLLRH